MNIRALVSYFGGCPYFCHKLLESFVHNKLWPPFKLGGTVRSTARDRNSLQRRESSAGTKQVSKNEPYGPFHNQQQRQPSWCKAESLERGPNDVH